MKRRYCKNVICRHVGRACNIGSVCHASVVTGCVPLSASSSHPVLSITSGFSNTITRQRRLTTTTVGRRSCHTHGNCMHAEQIIIIFYIYIFFCSLYLLLLLIVLYRTIVTVYTDNIFLYNYLWQMHKIIHHSPVGCFTPARGKTVQKIRDVSGVN